MKRNSNILKYSKRVEKYKSLKKGLKIAYYVFLLYFILMCMALLLGGYINLSENKAVEQTTDILLLNAEIVNQIIALWIVLGLSVAGAVTAYFNFALPLVLCSIISCLIGFVTFYANSARAEVNIMINTQTGGGLASFWGKIGVPALLCAVTTCVLAVFIYLDKIRINRQYDLTVKKLYAVHSNEGEKPILAEEFKNVLDNYNGDEIFRNDIPLKKSVKHRKDNQK